MKCLHPIRIQNDTAELFRKYNSSYRDVPCGKCEACIDNKRKEWLIRIKEEAECSYNSQFVTLTYDEASLPRNSLGFATFCKRDVQLMLKRLRFDLDKLQENHPFPLKLRYFIIGEYGSKFGRPHYHGLFFNIPKDYDLYRALHKFWPCGRISVSPVNQNRIGYVANYMYGKSEFMPDWCTDETNRLPMMSSRRPGIGANYVNFLTSSWHATNLKTYYQDGKFKYSLPRFWKDKIFNDEQKRIIFQQNQQRLKESKLKEIAEEIEYYQKTKGKATPLYVQRREEFLRKFYNRVKKHANNNKAKHNTLEYEYL